MAKYVKLNDLRSKVAKMFRLLGSKSALSEAIERATVDIESSGVLGEVDDFIRAKETEYKQGKRPVFYWADGEEE